MKSKIVFKSSVISTALAFIMTLGVGTAAVADVQTSDSWGTAPWTMTADGVVTIEDGILGSSETAPWDSNPAGVTKIVFAAPSSTVLPAESTGLFGRLGNVQEIVGIGEVDTTAVTNMSNMFQNAYSLTNLDGLSNWDTTNVTNMRNMFYGASALTNLNLAGWNTSSVKNMEFMFAAASSLENLNLAGWDTMKRPGFYGDSAHLISASSLALATPA